MEEYRQEANVSAPMHRILEQSDDYRRVNGKELSAEAKAKYDAAREVYEQVTASSLASRWRCALP